MSIAAWQAFSQVTLRGADGKLAWHLTS